MTEETKFPAGDFREYYFRGDRKKQVVEHVDALLRDLGPAASRCPRWRCDSAWPIRPSPA